MSVPKLRFTEFKGNWEINKVSSLFSIRSSGDLDKNLISPIKTESHKFPVFGNSVTDEGLLGYYPHYEEEAPAITITGRGVNIGTPFYRRVNFSAVGRLLVLHRLTHQTNPLFFSQLLSNLVIFNETTGVPQLTAPSIGNYLVAFPHMKEQEKISLFFDLLLKKIQLQQKKIDLLQIQKKGFMQQIFNQELRFKDNEGQTFSAWQNHALGTLGVFGTSYSYSRASEGQGFIQHIHYGDIHSTLPTICEDVQFPTITEQREWEFVREGDILFADASEDYKDLGKAILIKSLQSEKTVAGLHTHKFTPNELIEPLYLIYVTQTKEYREFIKRMGTGVSVLGISKTNLAKFNVLLPSLSEQKKIGEFLFALDKKIQALIIKKEFLNQQKQALMQQMFV